MLDPLRRADERQVGGRVVLLLALRDDVFAFLDQPDHPLAGLGAGGGAQNAEAFVQAFDLGLRLFQMYFEDALELRGAGGLGHLRQRFHELLFRVQDVAQLIDQELLG